MLTQYSATISITSSKNVPFRHACEKWYGVEVVAGFNIRKTHAQAQAFEFFRDSVHQPQRRICVYW